MSSLEQIKQIWDSRNSRSNSMWGPYCLTSLITTQMELYLKFWSKIVHFQSSDDILGGQKTCLRTQEGLNLLKRWLFFGALRGPKWSKSQLRSSTNSVDQLFGLHVNHVVFETKYGAVQDFQTANNAGKGQNRSPQDHPWIPLGLPWTPWALKTPQGAHSDLHIHPISSLHLLYYLLSLSNRPILHCHPKNCKVFTNSNWSFLLYDVHFIGQNLPITSMLKTTIGCFDPKKNLDECVNALNVGFACKISRNDYLFGCHQMLVNIICNSYPITKRPVPKLQSWSQFVS